MFRDDLCRDILKHDDTNPVRPQAPDLWSLEDFASVHHVQVNNA